MTASWSTGSLLPSSHADFPMTPSWSVGSLSPRLIRTPPTSSRFTYRSRAATRLELSFSRDSNGRALVLPCHWSLRILDGDKSELTFSKFLKRIRSREILSILRGPVCATFVRGPWQRFYVHATTADG